MLTFVSINESESIPTFDYIVKKLNNYDLAYLHLSEPFTDVTDVPGAEPNIAIHYRPMYKGTLMINTAFNRETGNKIIADGLADLVAYGKLFISNPDLVMLFREWSEADFPKLMLGFRVSGKSYLIPKINFGLQLCCFGNGAKRISRNHSNYEPCRVGAIK